LAPGSQEGYSPLKWQGLFKDEKILILTIIINITGLGSHSAFTLGDVLGITGYPAQYRITGIKKITFKEKADGL